MKNLLLSSALVVASVFNPLQAQYHVLELPQASPMVTETQKLGITAITVNYSSPSVKNRKIWGEVVPMNGQPIPWRAGANLNSTIEFSTDVHIKGNKLGAGRYGIQTIPREGEWTIIFTNNDNLWGSYYYDSLKDDALRIQVKPIKKAHTEWLQYNFIDRTEKSITLALEWEKLSIPIPIEIDLNETVVAHFRYQLRGQQNMSWGAWDAAAAWCLANDTHLEEALSWANRSIRGGYGGFRADKNFTNMQTKALILEKLNRKMEAKEVMKEAVPLGQAYDLYSYAARLSEAGDLAEALRIHAFNVDKFPEVWFTYLGYARTLKKTGNSKKAIKQLEKCKANAPDNRKEWIDGMIDKTRKGEEI